MEGPNFGIAPYSAQVGASVAHLPEQGSLQTRRESESYAEMQIRISPQIPGKRAYQENYLFPRAASVVIQPPAAETSRYTLG